MSGYRILLVTGIYPTARLPHRGTFIKSQADSLIAAGHSIELVHPDPRWPMPLRYLLAIGQVFGKTLTGRFDIVHGHFGLWCLVARMQWTTPVVASFLGDDLLGEPLPDGRWSRKAALVVAISRWLCHRVDAVIVKSEQMRQAAGFSSAFVIPNGVNFLRFRPLPRRQVRAELGWSLEEYYVLFGNNPRLANKRYALACEAISCLKARGVPVKLVVANGLSQEKVVQYMNACNALLLPSLREGSSNVVKEAMACNLPVVATAVGDVAQVIGKTAGCSICSDDPEEVATALQRAFAHSEPTTGRRDIASLEESLVAQRVIAVYTAAIAHKQKRSYSS